jgi:pyridoxine 5-phosphate synthase
MIRLGINVDHVATVRQARGEPYPDPVQAAVLAELGGADNITAHLREDRRHIQDRDVRLLKETIKIPLNFEMAVTEEMVQIALDLRPHAVTLVPERRQELTTEGGLDVFRFAAPVQSATARLKTAGMLVSLFIEPDPRAVEAAQACGADAVEFHTGRFCHVIDKALTTKDKQKALQPLVVASREAAARGLQSHFGHGLHYGNAAWLQHVPHCEEANIGHAVIGRAIFVGLEAAVREMKRLLNDPVCKP